MFGALNQDVPKRYQEMKKNNPIYINGLQW